MDNGASESSSILLLSVSNEEGFYRCPLCFILFLLSVSAGFLRVHLCQLSVIITFTITGTPCLLLLPPQTQHGSHRRHRAPRQRGTPDGRRGEIYQR